jgi:hypothetical protein
MHIRSALAARGPAAVVAAGVAAGAAGTAVATDGPTTVDGNGNGNGSAQAYGNTSASGVQSPQIGLAQGSLNKPCVGLAVTVDTGSLIGAIPVAAQTSTR